MSIYTMGIDVGSTASKCVIMKDGQEIVAKSLVPVGTGTSGPARAIAEVLDNAKMTREQMDFVLATGYGRNSLDGLADLQMSELSCHAKGATYLFPDVHTVVDIGGQDVKVIEIENGMMKNFVMNDKCDIIAGIHRSVAGRVSGLCNRVGVRDRVVMTGGVAQNHGIVKALENQLGHEISTSPLTQYNGALGAALFAYQKALKKQP